MITNLKAFDRRSDFDDLASAVGTGNDVVFDREGVSAVGDDDVAVVERNTSDSDEDFKVGDCRFEFCDLLEGMIGASVCEAVDEVRGHVSDVVMKRLEKLRVISEEEELSKLGEWSFI